MKKITLLLGLVSCLFAMSSFVSYFENESKESKKIDKTEEIEIKGVKKDKIEWLTFEEAINKSAQDNKPIFIDVYTDWCGWCKKMDKNTFQNSEVVEYVAQNYHAVKVDAESEDATSFDGQKLTYRQLTQGFFRITGYPSIVLINSKKEVTVAPGYRNEKNFIKMLKKFDVDNE